MYRDINRVTASQSQKLTSDPVTGGADGGTDGGSGGGGRGGLVFESDENEPFELELDSSASFTRAV